MSHTKLKKNIGLAVLEYKVSLEAHRMVASVVRRQLLVVQQYSQMTFPLKLLDCFSLSSYLACDTKNVKNLNTLITFV